MMARDCAGTCVRMLVAAALALAAAPAAAQESLGPADSPGWSIVPGVQLIQLHENNLLLGAPVRSEGAFTLLTPSLDARYRGEIGTFSAGYSFDQPVQSPVVNGVSGSLLERRVATLDFYSRPTERTAVSGRAQYLTTHRPEEVFDPAGLIISERRTVGVAADLQLEHGISPVSRARVAYTVRADDFGGATEVRPGTATIRQEVTTSLEKRSGERTAFALEQSATLLLGEERTTRTVTQATFWSTRVGLRWTHSLSPHVSAVLMAGPRLSQTTPSVVDTTQTTPVRWNPDVEALASINYRDTGRNLSLAYRRAQTLGYGASGFIDTDSLEVGAAWVFARRLQAIARPAVYRNTLAGLRAKSYRLDMRVRYFITSSVSIDALFNRRYQDRALALADLTVTSVTRARTRDRIALGVTIRQPVRIQ